MSAIVSKEHANLLAKKCADVMWANDIASWELGMKIVEVGAGTATMTMTITSNLLNGHKTCHGGYVFMLADSCFAFASNSYNQIMVGQHCTINYLAPAYEGDVLTATATEIHKQGRSGLYDVRVTNQDHQLVVSFKGNARQINGIHISSGCGAE